MLTLLVIVAVIVPVDPAEMLLGDEQVAPRQVTGDARLMVLEPSLSQLMVMEFAALAATLD